jgi:predicted Fe-S protein YdhL (DUF1289 family)
MDVKINKIDERRERPLSPCILLCTLDDNKQCLGCGRTLDEISYWALKSADEQWQIIDQLDARQRANDDTIAPESGD